MTTISVDIATGADDGMNLINGAGPTTYPAYGNTFLKAGVNGAASRDVALRFQSVNVPQGTTITSATLTVKTDGNTQGSPAVQIYGVDTDNAAAWGVGNRIRTATKTSQHVTMDVSGDSVNDVTAIAQAIINRGGWVANNAMAFGLFNTHAQAGSNYFRGYAYEKGGSNIPNLTIVYSGGGAPPQDALWFGMSF